MTEIKNLPDSHILGPLQINTGVQKCCNNIFKHTLCVLDLL